MILETILPNLKTLPMAELVKVIPGKYAVMFSNELAEYYDSYLQVSDIYAYYGVEIRTRMGNEFQVQCLLPTHNTRDTHASARFYIADRKTGEVRPRVYCFKCGKVNTLFWMLYRIEEANGRKYNEMFEFIYQIFRIPFPLDIFLKLDPETHYIMERDQVNELSNAKIKADYVRGLKFVKPAEYLKELKNILIGGGGEIK